MSLQRFRARAVLVRGSLVMMMILGLIGCGSLLPFGQGPAIEEFSATPNEVSSGGAVLLSWQVNGGEGTTLRLEAMEAGSDQAVDLGDVTGRENLAVQAWKDTSYRLYASSPEGESSRVTAVNVVDDGENAPVIERFTASPSGPVAPGSKVTLSWTVTNADSVTITPPGQSVASSGSLEVTVDATSSYVIHATNSDGTSSDELTVTVSGDGNGGEKILILIAGQSNASGAGREEGGGFPVDGLTEEPQDGVWMLNEDEEWVRAAEPTHDGYRHSFGLRLGKEIRSATGVDVYLVPAAVGGSPLRSWDPDDGDYFARALARIEFAADDLGVPVSAVVWFQGESDTKYGSTRRDFLSNTDEVLKAFHDRLAGTPDVIFVQLSKRLFHGTVEGDNIEGHNLAYQEIREKQRLMEGGAVEYVLDTNPGSSPFSRSYYHMVVSHDLPMSDIKHISAAGQRELGVRIANAFLTEVWSGPVSGTWGPGPRLERVYLDGSAIVVDTTRPVNAHSSYDGYFTVFVGGSKVTPVSIGRDPADSSRVRITLGSAPTGDVYVRYMPPDGTDLYQATPNAVHSTVGGMRLPLPAFGLPVELASGASFPGARLDD